jgi:predicted DNA-binding protein
MLMFTEVLSLKGTREHGRKLAELARQTGKTKSQVLRRLIELARVKDVEVQGHDDDGEAA